MIPPDVASNLRLLLPDQQALTSANSPTQPVSPPSRVTDALSNMAPGQKILAEIQALLPNGTYRAVVAQRDITLALPFSAKAGDVLELVVARREGDVVVAKQVQAEASAARLTTALGNLAPGQRLFAEIQAQLPNGAFRALVGERPITLALPFAAKPGDTLELEVTESEGELQLAVVANRGAGETATANKAGESVATTLSQTGRLILDLIGNTDDPGSRAAPAPLNGNQPLVSSFPDQAADLAPILQNALSKSGVFYEAHQARWVAGELPTEVLQQEPQGKLSEHLAPAVNVAPEAKTIASTHGRDTLQPAMTVQGQSTAPPQASTTPENTPLQNSPIPRELVPIVQQQLDGLATQNFAWQGQIWPGQPMWWEISENADHATTADNETAARWQTRLKLALPSLGDIEATLRLRGDGQIELAVTSESTASENRLRKNIAGLQLQFETAGLKLAQLNLQHGETAE